MANLGVTLRFIFHSLDVQYEKSTKDKIALHVFHVIVKLTKPSPCGYPMVREHSLIKLSVSCDYHFFFFE
jgi:hypothetical protein